MWMNRMDIEEAVELRRMLPNRHRAARFLKEFMDEVDQHSDGWPYWNPPAKAAKQLMEIVHKRPDEYRGLKLEDVTPAQLNKALAPIKAFYTRRGYKAGMKLPVVA